MHISVFNLGQNFKIWVKIQENLVYSGLEMNAIRVTKAQYHYEITTVCPAPFINKLLV